MGAFVSLLQRPPQETGFEAAAEGQNQALSAQSLMQAAQIRKEQISQAQLQTQEQQRAIADQDAFRKAYNESYNDPAANSSEAKLAKFQALAPKYGVNPAHTQELIKSTIENRTKMATMAKDERENLEAHNKAIGIAAQGLLSLPDDATRAAQLPSVVDDLVANHHITAEHGAYLKANPPDANALSTLSAHAKSMDDFFKEQKEKDDKPLRDAQLSEAQGKARQTTLQNASGVMEKAANESEDAYARAYYKLDPEIAAQFTHPKQYDVKKTPVDARAAGESPNQRSLREQSAANAADASDWKSIAATDREEGLRLREEALNKEKKQTANSEAITRRTAERQLITFESQEAKLNKRRRELGSLLKTGLDAKGQPIDRDSIQGQYEDATNELEQALTNKYDAADRAGRGVPSVPLDRAIAGIRAGAKPPETPPPVAATPKVPKSAAVQELPDNVVATIPEGKAVKYPDGSVRKKVKGKMVEVKHP